MVALMAMGFGRNKEGDKTTIPAGEFKVYGSLVAVLPDFDFDAKCSVLSFDLVYMPVGKDAMNIANKGYAFDVDMRAAVRQARPGDCYVFTNIKAKCPGDEVGRPLASVTYMIK